MTNEIREKAIEAASITYNDMMNDAASEEMTFLEYQGAVLKAMTAAIDAYEKALWRPIAEVEKCGPVLVSCESPDGSAFVTRAWWNPQFEGTWDDDQEAMLYRGAWTDGSVADWGMQELAEIEPTHVRPLPAPPEVG